MSDVRLRFNGKEAQEQQGDGNANYDPSLLDKKVTMATEGLEPFFTKILRQKPLKKMLSI